MTCKDIAKLEGGEDEVTNISWSNNGDKLVSSSKDGLLRIWNIPDREINENDEEEVKNNSILIKFDGDYPQTVDWNVYY